MPIGMGSWAQENPLVPAAATSESVAPVGTPKPKPLSEIWDGLTASRQVVYKTVGDVELRLHVFLPPDWKSSDKRSCLVAFHGGGWTGGSPKTMYGVASHCAEQGMVGISVAYRLYKPDTENTVWECVKDARSAVRYVRAHAKELGIAKDKIATAGASAGGHLAAATAMFEVDEAGEDTTVSCAPNAIILYTPVIDTSKEGYGNVKLKARWEELSPAHKVRAGMPPTLLFHGTNDTVTPYLGAQRFHEAMMKAGNRCEFISKENGIHTYMFKDMNEYKGMLRKIDTFFTELGFLPSTPKS